MWAQVIQVVTALGGLSAIGLVARQVYLMRTDRAARRSEIKGNEQSAMIRFLSESHPEIARLAARLKEQDDYIEDLEQRFITMRREKLELELSLAALEARANQLDIQLSKAMTELNELRRDQ